MKKRCGICGQKRRLVRDHDHVTGNIRGRLCNPCNGRLGAYEAEKRRGPYVTSRGYLWWVGRFREKIEEHLKKDTGVKYVPRGPRLKRFNLKKYREPNAWKKTKEDAQAFLGKFGAKHRRE